MISSASVRFPCSSSASVGSQALARSGIMKRARRIIVFVIIRTLLVAVRHHAPRASVVLSPSEERGTARVRV